MAGPRPTKPKSPVADRSDKNDNAIPGPNNPDRVFQRSNTMGSLAEIQRQQSQEAKAVPVLALDQVGHYGCLFVEMPPCVGCEAAGKSLSY
jgi:hypothetical protein